MPCPCCGSPTKQNARSSPQKTTGDENDLSDMPSKNIVLNKDEKGIENAQPSDGRDGNFSKILTKNDDFPVKSKLSNNDSIGDKDLIDTELSEVYDKAIKNVNGGSNDGSVDSPINLVVDKRGSTQGMQDEAQDKTMPLDGSNATANYGKGIQIGLSDDDEDEYFSVDDEDDAFLIPKEKPGIHLVNASNRRNVSLIFRDSLTERVRSTFYCCKRRSSNNMDGVEIIEIDRDSIKETSSTYTEGTSEGTTSSTIKATLNHPIARNVGHYVNNGASAATNFLTGGAGVTIGLQSPFFPMIVENDEEAKSNAANEEEVELVSDNRVGVSDILSKETSPKSPGSASGNSIGISVTSGNASENTSGNDPNISNQNQERVSTSVSNRMFGLSESKSPITTPAERTSESVADLGTTSEANAFGGDTAENRGSTCKSAKSDLKSSGIATGEHNAIGPNLSNTRVSGAKRLSSTIVHLPERFSQALRGYYKRGPIKLPRFTPSKKVAPSETEVDVKDLTADIHPISDTEKKTTKEEKKEFLGDIAMVTRKDPNNSQNNDMTEMASGKNSEIENPLIRTSQPADEKTLMQIEKQHTEFLTGLPKHSSKDGSTCIPYGSHYGSPGWSQTNSDTGGASHHRESTAEVMISQDSAVEADRMSGMELPSKSKHATKLAARGGNFHSSIRKGSKQAGETAKTRGHNANDEKAKGNSIIRKASRVIWGLSKIVITISVAYIAFLALWTLLDLAGNASLGPTWSKTIGYAGNTVKKSSISAVRLSFATVGQIYAHTAYTVWHTLPVISLPVTEVSDVLESMLGLTFEGNLWGSSSLGIEGVTGVGKDIVVVLNDLKDLQPLAATIDLFTILRSVPSGIFVDCDKVLTTIENYGL